MQKKAEQSAQAKESSWKPPVRYTVLGVYNDPEEKRLMLLDKRAEGAELVVHLRDG